MWLRRSTSLTIHKSLTLSLPRLKAHPFHNFFRIPYTKNYRNLSICDRVIQEKLGRRFLEHSAYSLFTRPKCITTQTSSCVLYCCSLCCFYIAVFLLSFVVFVYMYSAHVLNFNALNLFTARAMLCTVYAMVHGTSVSDLKWPSRSFAGCRPFQVQAVEHLCSILPDFSWQRPRAVPQQ